MRATASAGSVTAGRDAGRDAGCATTAGRDAGWDAGGATTAGWDAGWDAGWATASEERESSERSAAVNGARSEKRKVIRAPVEKLGDVIALR
ncbi:hypothetical protein KKF91_02785, partial [Myxococcota bacterium]|nr:hypothetical protein [Myxococcota bacterium]